MEAVELAGQPGAYAGASMEGSEELIARARRGDAEAFRHIFERYTRPVISFIFYMVGERALAEELAQETFVRVYKSIHRLRDEARLSTWLFGIAKNVAREALRAKRRTAQQLDFDSTPDNVPEMATPIENLLDKELAQVMRRALDQLDEEKRLVFVLKIYRQHSYDEICEITGFSLPKVRNDLYRARAEMRRRLSQYLGSER